MKQKIDFTSILLFIFLFFSVYLLSEVSTMSRQLKEKQLVLDSLESEVIILEDALKARKEEVDLLLQLNEDDFDRVNNIEKIERLFEE